MKRGGIAPVVLLGGMLIDAAPGAAQSAQHDANRADLAFEDIVITARRRAEASQFVPLAVTAYSGASLERAQISTAQDLNGRVPSVNVGSGGTIRNSEVFTIRGQGAVFQAPPGVVQYLAEVPLIPDSYFPQQGGPGQLYDLESVQILRGPQGTLFGRNTTGGAVVISPAKPSSTFEGYLQGQIGNYGSKEIQGAVNLPIVHDSLLLRLAGRLMDRRGFTVDAGPSYVVSAPGKTTTFTGKDYDDRHFWTARVGLTWRPADSIENYLLAYRTEQDENGNGSVLTRLNADAKHPIVRAFLRFGSFYDQNGAAVTADDIISGQGALGPRRTAFNTDTHDKLKLSSVIDILDVELSDKLTLRNIVSYQRLTRSWAWDFDGSLLPLNGTNNGQDQRQTDSSMLTEEIQFQGKGADGGFEYVIGGYMDRQRPEGQQLLSALNFFNPSVTVIERRVKSRAFYAQGTLDLSIVAPALQGVNFTGGLRYTWDDVYGERTDAGRSPVFAAARLKTSAPTWTAGLDYRIDRRVLIFGRASRGYKSGSFNAIAADPKNLTFLPEYVTSFELGTKADFELGEMPVRLNIALHRSGYNGIQRSYVDYFDDRPLDSLPGRSGGAIFNIESARIQGVEVEAMIRPVKGMELTASYGHLDAKYRKFRLPMTGFPIPISNEPFSKGTCNGSISPPIGVTVLPDLAPCLPFAYAPRHTLNVSGSYELSLPKHLGAVTLSAAYTYVSKIYQPLAATPAEEPDGFIPGYGLLNIGIEWRGVRGLPLDLGFFMTNATGKLYRIGQNASTSSVTGFQPVTFGEPRMYGVRVRHRFGE